MGDTKQCSKLIYDKISYAGMPHHCRKPALREQDGKWYCKIHDPEYIKAKNAKWHADFDAKYQIEREQDELRVARTIATKGLTLAELKLVTPELIRKALRG